MSRDIEQLPVLVLAQMLGNVHVESRATIEILHIILSMELELVNHGKSLILRIIEVRTIHIVLWRNKETVLLVPLIVLA